MFKFIFKGRHLSISKGVRLTRDLGVQVEKEYRGVSRFKIRYKFKLGAGGSCLQS
jgi:hypothetical protein